MPPAGDDVRHYFQCRVVRVVGRRPWAGRDEWLATGDYARTVVQLTACASRRRLLMALPFPLRHNAALAARRRPTNGTSVIWDRLRTLGQRHADCAQALRVRRHLMPLRLRCLRLLCGALGETSLEGGVRLLFSVVLPLLRFQRRRPRVAALSKGSRCRKCLVVLEYGWVCGKQHRCVGRVVG